MKKLYLIVIACLTIVSIKAQTTAVEHENNTWFLDKNEAIDSARAQNKQILLCYGRDECPNTNGVRRMLGAENLKGIVDGTYILWYANTFVADRFSPTLSEYIGWNALPLESLTLPVLAVINMYDIHKAFGITTGPKYEYELIEMLSRYVANDKIASGLNENVYVSGSGLFVSSGALNETVSVYSITGSLIDKFKKTDYSITRDMSAYPSGILIVSGSSGWNKKVITARR
jgi:hypothetical protein